MCHHEINYMTEAKPLTTKRNLSYIHYKITKQQNYQFHIDIYYYFR